MDALHERPLVQGNRLSIVMAFNTKRVLLAERKKIQEAVV